MLHIKGAVYNRAQRSVKAPEFIVSIKDDDPALDKEIPAALPVEGDRILPDERAEFESGAGVAKPIDYGGRT